MRRSNLLATCIAVVIIIVGTVPVAASLSAKLLNMVTSRSGYSLETDIAYGPSPRHRLDLYTPDDVSSDAPVVVFFYGGGWNRGDRRDYLFIGQSLASAGFIVVIPDYRLHPDVVFPAFINDAARAVAYVHDRFRSSEADGRRLFLSGHSAGAHIAAMLNLDEQYLQSAGVSEETIAGVIGLSGPYDFLPLKADIYKATFPEEVRAQSQPIKFVDGSEAPMLLITGDADRVVEPGNTTRLAAVIAAQGGDAKVSTYRRVGHIGTVGGLATAKPWRGPPIRQEIIDFIRARQSELSNARAR